MVDFPKHSCCPKLYETENIIVPINVEIPPFPIRLKEVHENTTIQIYGLPDGLSYDLSSSTLIGYPTSIGRHGITVIAQNNYGFDCIGFNINVITYDTVPINIKKIDDHTMYLGKPMDIITVDIDDKTATVIVKGLPDGIIYDSYLEQISGFPETPGDYRVSIHATNKYGTETIAKFMLHVQGTIDPSIDLTITASELIVDKDYKFHAVDDQIIYIFTVKNNGNVPLTKIRIEDPLLGFFHSNNRSLPEGKTIFKYSYQLQQKDLLNGSININTVASGFTSNGIKITTRPVSHDLTIRGHDNITLNIKSIKFAFYPKTNTIKQLFMIVNGSNDVINDLKMNDTYGQPLIIDSDKLIPNGITFARSTHKLKIEKEPTNTIETHIMAVGKLSDGQIVGNTYDHKENKNALSVKLYCSRCYIKESQSVVFLAHVYNKNTKVSLTSSGIVKFYDGIQLIGKSNVHDEIAILQVNDLTVGKHFIYAVYQKNDISTENGSDILIEFVGDDKTLSTDHLSYIKTHQDTFKKIESKAFRLLRSSLTNNK